MSSTLSSLVLTIVNGLGQTNQTPAESAKVDDKDKKQEPIKQHKTPESKSETKVFGKEDKFIIAQLDDEPVATLGPYIEQKPEIPSATTLPKHITEHSVDEWLDGEVLGVSAKGAAPVAVDGESSVPESAPVESSLVPELLLTGIDEKGVPLEAQNHCKWVAPFYSQEEADKVDLPGMRQFVQASAWGLDKIDKGFDELFIGVATVDKFMFEQGIDELPNIGLNDLIEDEKYKQYARWGERTALFGGMMGLHYLQKIEQNPALRGLPFKEKLKQVHQSSMGQVKSWGPMYGAMFLMATQLPSHAAKILDLVDPNQEYFREGDRKTARAVTYATVIGASATLLNFPHESSYRQVIAPEVAAKAYEAKEKEFVLDSLGRKVLDKACNPKMRLKVRPLSVAAGLGFAGFYAAWSMGWDNFSIQQRILPHLKGVKPSAAYWPGNWDMDYAQAHTATADMAVWAATGSAWGALLRWQNQFTKKLTEKTMGFGDEVLKLTESERAFVARTRLGKIGRAGRTLATFVNPFGKEAFKRALKRGTYTAVSTAVGLPLGIGIGKIMYGAQAYSSKEATAGTPLRAIFTSPASTLGMNVFASMGKATPWTAYTFNMIPLNYTWKACSAQGQNLFQASRALADDYKSTSNSDTRAKLRTQMFNLYQISYDNGKDVTENEKLQIRNVMENVGINVDAVKEEAALISLMNQPTVPNENEAWAL